MRLIVVGEVTPEQAAWFSPQPGQKKQATATEAYHTAAQQLKEELDIGQCAQIPEDKAASIEEVCATVSAAKKRYDDSSSDHNGVRAWLGKLSGRVMHFQPIMDALAQHHPEYVALAWGTLKLILTGIINRANLIKELAEALVNIADKLPRAHLNVELYKTTDMEAALSKLYACILMFFRLCHRWHNRSECGRLSSSLKDSFELKYNDLLLEVERASGVVGNLATAGACVEIRNVHALTRADHAKLLGMDAGLKTAFEAQTLRLDSLDRRVSNIKDGQATLEDGQLRLESRRTRLDPTDPKVIQLSDGREMLKVQVTQIYSIVQGSQLILNQTHRTVYRLEFHHILEFFMPKTLPGSALQKIKPLVQRRPLMSNPRLESMLRAWGRDPQSAILVFNAATREQKQASELAADVVNHLRGSAQSVFWRISNGGSRHQVTMADVFKSIIYQALQQWGAAYADLGEQLHPHKLHGTHTAREWVDLICLLFANLPSAFLVLETKDLRDTYTTDRDWTNQLLEYLQIIVDRAVAARCRVKVLLLLYGSKASICPAAHAKDNVRVVSLQQIEVPARLKNKAGHSGLNLKGWGLKQTIPPQVR
ncbi:hypothetical protein C7974DRAFT_34011 [Boeremia exigua]|uniref:uncharacterized protein n=1 Tax=Boeremia exigua TaxID=749465 RepID=UPI001E8D75BC|nr:uncharacterized protein C7974DRAFT_34011 [Boeremia exigua]KAH6618646.1 hypothetical protein C7974DRAFT_34011 [Boeremia exigua]